jgi:Fibronectin type III domain
MKWQTVMQHVRPVRCIVALACVSIALVLSGCAAPAPDVHTPAPAAHAAQVHLSWEPPTTRTDGTPLTDIVGYTLHYGVTSRTYAFIKHLGNQTSCEVSGLEPGRTYFFAVTARDAAGHESAFSDELHTTVPALVDQQLMLWLDPLIRGRETTFQVMGAHPHEVVSFLFSSEGEGEGPCSAQLGGLCGDLLSPSVFGEATADASGLATLTRPIPADAPPGQHIAIQAVIQRGPAGAHSVKTNAITARVME